MVATRLPPALRTRNGAPNPGELQVGHDALEDFRQLLGLGLGLDLAARSQPNVGQVDTLDKHLIEIV